MTDMQERVARLDAMIAEGRVLREQWTDGHERACLLAAISPEAGRAGSAGACPAHVMPAWLAHLTPWIDDEASDDAWPGVIRRYAALARRWGVLDDAAWERARVASLIAIVSEARTHCPAEVCALAAIDGVLEWLRRGAPDPARASSARASSARAEAARSRASRAASRAAASAATRAASRAASRASRAASWAAEAAVRAAEAAGREAAAEAADRIAAAVLDAIEAEIEREEP